VTINSSTHRFTQSFSAPGREGFETNSRILHVYGNGGNYPTLVPVVSLPSSKTVDSSGVRAGLRGVESTLRRALPGTAPRPTGTPATARSSRGMGARPSCSPTRRGKAFPSAATPVRREVLAVTLPERSPSVDALISALRAEGAAISEKTNHPLASSPTAPTARGTRT